MDAGEHSWLILQNPGEWNQSLGQRLLQQKGYEETWGEAGDELCPDHSGVYGKKRLSWVGLAVTAGLTSAACD